MSSKPPLEMNIELTVIEDLGIKLYGRLPPVLSELVANSWDADAHEVSISLPVGEINENSTLEVSDDGYGMSYDDIRQKYLRIGRKRREEEHSNETPGGRKLMGRKGIGKLSVFGVAKTVEVETITNYTMTSFRMDIDDILREAREKGKYRPKVIEDEKKVTKKQGTIVRLMNLKRRSPIESEPIRRDVAKHFSVISGSFKVLVNDKRITNADKYNKDLMEYLWNFKNVVIDETHPKWKVSGWIGSTESPLDEDDRGIIIMARGKLLQAPTTFETKVGEKFTYSYIIGELNAEFFDDEEDLISTNRQSLIWETPQGIALKEWGKKTLKQISTEWNEKRRSTRERVIREDPKFREWLTSLEKPESQVADKMIRVITSSERLEDERRKELAQYMMESFDQKVFRDMINTLDKEPDPVALLEVFQEWDVIEAREILRLVKGRMNTIEQLEKYIDTNAKEVPTLHEYFKKWPWILDPTWTRWQDEVRYSKLLVKQFPDDKLEESDRRIDFVCIGVGDTVHVIELKRSGYKVKSKDFDQLIDYVEFIKENLGTVKGRGYYDVAGYIVAGGMQNDRVTRHRKSASENDRMYVKRYEDLIVVARQLHADFEKKLNEFNK